MRRLLLLAFPWLLASSCQHAEDEDRYGPLDTLTIQVTGDDYRWYSVYPGADGLAGTEDDLLSVSALHVPARTRVKLSLSSRDYVYTLALPHLGLKEVAVPEMFFDLEFQEDTPGTYELLGDQLCGYAHPNLLGELVVESRRDFVKWLDGLDRESGSDRPQGP